MAQLKISKNRFWATLSGLRGNICTPSVARWKALCDFLFAIIEFVRSLLWLRRYKRQSVKVGILWRGWITSRLNFRLKVTFHANIYGPLGRGMTVLQFCCGSFHTKKLCTRLYSNEVDFYSKKTKKIAFWATLSGLKGNVCTPSIAHWKACGRFSICHVELFRYLLRLSCYEWKSVEVVVFQRGWVSYGEYLTGKEASPTNHCWCQKTRVIAVSCGIKISAVHHLVLSQYTRLTDGRTDRQDCDSNTMRCITCSGMVKINRTPFCRLLSLLESMSVVSETACHPDCRVSFVWRRLSRLLPIRGMFYMERG